MSNKEIGEIIKERRLELGLTQEQLADRLGYRSKSTINKIELGINDVSQKKIVKFANALNTTASYLMGWTTDPSPMFHFNKDTLTDDELAMISAYRDADPNVKKAVRLMLGIEK